MSVRSADVARLVVLAMIWSASFVFFRVLAEPVGPVPTVTFRVLVAGLVLVVWLAWTSRAADVRGNWRAYLFMGVFNSAIPFVLFAYAAYTLPAAVMAILNAATPMFTALLAARWLGETLDGRKLAGILAGVAGVACVLPQAKSGSSARCCASCANRCWPGKLPGDTQKTRCWRCI